MNESHKFVSFGKLYFYIDYKQVKQITGIVIQLCIGGIQRKKHHALYLFQNCYFLQNPFYVQKVLGAHEPVII